MKTSSIDIINNFFSHRDDLSYCKNYLISAVKIIKVAFREKKKLLVCGNGGSASDSLHIVGELSKSFVKNRPISNDLENSLKSFVKDNSELKYLVENLENGLPTISLVSESSLITAFGNDKVFDLVFAQQVLTLGVEGDVLLAISTSGNSKNVVYAAQVAKAKNMKVIALSGKGGGLLSRYSDVNIIMHGEETFKIQENHLPIYHLICLVIENEFF